LPALATDPDRATYMVMRIINCTNVCVAQRDHCAFYVLPNQDGGYVLAQGGLRESTSWSSSAATVAFNGGFNKLPLDFCDLFAAVRALRRPRRVLRVDDRGVRLPGRPCADRLRGRQRACVTVGTGSPAAK
jgi:hypothetical protein